MGDYVDGWISVFLFGIAAVLIVAMLKGLVMLLLLPYAIWRTRRRSRWDGESKPRGTGEKG